MNNLELRHLKRYCDEYGIDYQEIDDTLTYWENKQHLRTIARMLSQSLDEFELRRMEELQKQYMKEHLLSYYLLCQLDGQTRSRETGEIPSHYPRFSLETFIQQTR